MPTNQELSRYIQGRLRELKKGEKLYQEFGFWREGTTQQMQELRLLASEFDIPLESELQTSDIPPVKPDPLNVK